MEDVVNIDDFKKKQKKDERKQAFKTKMNEIGDWCNRNPLLATAIVTASVAIVTSGTKGVIDITKKLIDNNTARHQMRVDMNRVYDPSAGFYWYTKRELTSNQKLQIETRHKNGESIGSILQSMGVLK